MNKKTISIFIMLIVIIVGIILSINYIRANNSQDEKTMQCIAENSKILVSKTCSACAYQKEILKDYIDYFEIIDCTTNIEECRKYKITGFPTWIINEKKYPGAKSIEKLKELTGC